MEKKIAGLLGAMATLGAFNGAEAAPAPSPAPTDILRANSFADLLEPIPNAAALLRADPSKSDRRVAAESGLNRTDVGFERKKLEQTGEVSIPDTRVGKTASRSPPARPCPMNGGVRWAASPSRKTRPLRKRDASRARKV